MKTFLDHSVLRQLLSIFLFLLLILAASPTSANDSAASTASGGIVLKREARISMEKERLFISEKKVTVDYDFLNESDQDITTDVAFPIPPFDFEFDDQPRSFDYFKVWVQEQPLDYQTEVRAFLKGADRTSVFQQLDLKLTNFSLFEFDFMTGKCKSPKLAEEVQKALIQEDLIDAELLCPNWSIHKTYYWTQTFPAHKRIHVRHEYKPVVGFYSPDGRELDAAYREKERAELVERAKTDKLINPESLQLYFRPLEASCIDPGLKDKLSREATQEWPGPAYQEREGILSLTWVDYILTTANSWKTPIKDFELEVERPLSQTQFPGHVSFCWDGEVKRMDSTHFVAKATDFVPKKELTVAFLTVMPEHPHPKK